jgi:hypothetical protein
MALTINDTSYAGTAASYLILPATYGLDTISKGLVYVQDGIKKEHTIDRIDITTPLQSRVPTPTSKGEFTIDGRTLIPQDLMFYTEFNPRNLEQNWFAEELSPTLLAREIPVTVENYMIQVALNRMFEQLELGIWMGSTRYNATPGSAGVGQLMFFDGFLKQMVADTAVQKVASPATIVSTPTIAGTSNNILDVFDSLINLGVLNKKALFSNPNRFKRLKFLVSIEDEQIYQAASISLQFKGQLTQSGETQPYKGFQVVATAGIPKDTVLLVEATDDTSSNLWVGINSTEDAMLQLMRLQNNSELFFLKGLMKFSTQYGWSEQVFMYTTLTAETFTGSTLIA